MEITTREDGVQYFEVVASENMQMFHRVIVDAELKTARLARFETDRIENCATVLEGGNAGEFVKIIHFAPKEVRGLFRIKTGQEIWLT